MPQLGGGGGEDGMSSALRDRLRPVRGRTGGLDLSLRLRASPGDGSRGLRSIPTRVMDRSPRCKAIS
jgi:hypothetical protein